MRDSDRGEPPLHGLAFVVVALLLVTLATALRVYHLDTRSLWFDEAVAANISRRELSGTEESFFYFNAGYRRTRPAQSEFSDLLELTRSLDSAPIVHPYILYVIQKAEGSVWALRAPSALVSLLAVVVILAMARAGIDPMSAMFAATILTISHAQIRYAQEIREYSLAVLFAAILIFGFFKWHTRAPKWGAFTGAALFVAPFIQYGLVLFGFGILAAMGLLYLVRRNESFSLSDVVLATGCLGAGCLLSGLLTLRYQLHGNPAYLTTFYFDAKATSLPRFLFTTTKSLLSFLLPGRFVVLAFVLAVVTFGYRASRDRFRQPILYLGLTSVAVIALAGLMRLYPYGGVRQCIFLAPIVALSAGTVFSQLVDWFRAPRRIAAASVALATIVASGCVQLAHFSPYMEIEDIKTVIDHLAQSRGETDKIYIYWGAAPAVNFYFGLSDRQLVYGNYYEDDTKKYAMEILATMGTDISRMWLVFAHPIATIEQEIIDALRQRLDVTLVKAAAGADLYLARTRETAIHQRTTIDATRQ